MESAIYQVKTAAFEGPLHLLLSLIDKRKLFINDISLAQVTDDYIAYVKNLPKVNFLDTANFIVVAATLILIKSKSLLPQLALTEDEEGSIEELEARLRMYKRIKEIGRVLQDLFGKNIIFARPHTIQEVIAFTPGKKLTSKLLASLIQETIDNIPQKVFIPEATVQKVITIEDMIQKLTERIQSSLNLSFKDFSLRPAALSLPAEGEARQGRQRGEEAKDDPENIKEQKIYLIVSFLALLELVRQGIVEVIQESHFENIEIAKAPIAKAPSD